MTIRMRIVAMNPGHDSSVVYIDGGRLVSSIEAEHDSNPRHSGPSVDNIAKFINCLEEPPEVLALGGWWGTNASYFGIDGSAIEASSKQLESVAIRRFSSSHERSHIWASYGLSPFEQGVPCYVLVWEGEIGSFYSISNDLTIEKIATPLDRPGQRFSSLYELADPSAPGTSCGYSYDAAGKLMALASFGEVGRSNDAEDEVVAALMSDRVVLKDDLSSSLLANIGVEDQRLKNAAAKLSSAMFDRFFQSARQFAVDRRPLLVGGGCGLNCDWNSKWLNSDLFSEVFVPPCVNDSGSALGTGIDAQRHFTGNAKLTWTAYPGEIFVEGSDVVDGFSRKLVDFDEVSEALLQGRIFAWVQGRCEMGPRALGNRSILAAPFNAATRDRLNAIKQREPYRPIAPVCLEDDVDEWFEGKIQSPHMLFLHRVRRPGLEAVTHIDGTARLQSVRHVDNPLLHRLLTAFKSRSGVGVLCNTSLNFKGKGFINRMDDLRKFVVERGVDGMVVGEYLYQVQG